jgi:MFS family permease
LAFFWPFTTIYVHTVMHRSLTTAGLVLMAQAGSNIVGSLVGGQLFDRLGGRRAIAFGVIGAIVTLVGLYVADLFWPYALLVTTFGLCTGAISPALYAFSVTAWPQGGRQAFNAIYVAQNVGVAVGTVGAGVVASLGGLRSTFLANAAMMVVFFCMALVTYRGPAFARVPRVRQPGPWTHRRRQRPLLWPALLLLGGLMLDWVAYSQWTTTTATYIHREGIPLPLYTLLWTINGGVILLGQPITLWMTRALPGIKSQLLVGNVFFFISCLVLMLTSRYVGYVAAMVMTTFGEMMVTPGVPAQIYEITPSEHVGYYQGLVSGAGSAGRMIGPVLGGVLYAAVSRFDLYGIMAGAVGSASCLYLWHDRKSSPVTASGETPSAK